MAILLSSASSAAAALIDARVVSGTNRQYQFKLKHIEHFVSAAYGQPLTTPSTWMSSSTSGWLAVTAPPTSCARLPSIPPSAESSTSRPSRQFAIWAADLHPARSGRKRTGAPSPPTRHTASPSPSSPTSPQRRSRSARSGASCSSISRPSTWSQSPSRSCSGPTSCARVVGWSCRRR